MQLDRIIKTKMFTSIVSNDNNTSIIANKVKIKSKLGQNATKKRENLENSFILTAQIERKKASIRDKQDRKKQFFARNKKQ